MVKGSEWLILSGLPGLFSPAGVLVLGLGLLLDRLLGEPRRLHPLVGFGHLAGWIENRINRSHRMISGRISGLIALLILVVPCLLPALWLHTVAPFWLTSLFDACVLYLAVGWRSLREHGQAVDRALQSNDLPGARAAVARIVSRDTQDMDEQAVAGATIESLLENGNDAVFGVLFWYLAGGAPAVIAYRLINTLDALWGYRNRRFLYFGWAAARLDDLFNYLPARLTACSYLLLGDRKTGWRCWMQQAPTWQSPNAGPVMAAGAGSLNLMLGGNARYEGQWETRPPLGSGKAPAAPDITRALGLIGRAIRLWLIVSLLLWLALWLTFQMAPSLESGAWPGPPAPVPITLNGLSHAG